MNRALRKSYKYILISLIIIATLSSLVLIARFPAQSESNCKTAHISFDDIYEVLMDITENENIYESVFDNEFLKILKNMNEDYGAKFALYIYDSNPKNSFDVRKVSSKYREEFITNSNWLKFGYHSIEPTTSFDHLTSINEFKESFIRVNNEIKRFAGEESITTVLRLNYFRASPDKIEYLFNQGVSGLLCSDDDRISYDLSKEQHEELKLEEKILYNGMTYYNTDFRFDGKKFILYEMMKLRDNEVLVLFAHEWALENNGLDRIETAIKWLSNNNYKFSFLE